LPEIIVYQGALSDPDRLAVVNYLQAKYLQNTGPAVSYQWLLNGTNVAGATNATLTVSALQSTNAGTYAVVVTNAQGSVTSSPAVVSISVPLAISQSGTNVVLSWPSSSFAGNSRRHRPGRRIGPTSPQPCDKWRQSDDYVIHCHQHRIFPLETLAGLIRNPESPKLLLKPPFLSLVGLPRVDDN